VFGGYDSLQTSTAAQPDAHHPSLGGFVTATQRFLHVANGSAATDLIAAAGIPGTLSIWADPLYEGPVPSGLTDAELLDVRNRFLAGDDPGIDPVNDLRRWRAVIADHSSYDELILWFEHDLFDQLNLIQVLTWIVEHVAASKRVSLICIGSFPGRPEFHGLGELTPGELASLLDTRQPVGEAQYTLAQRAWSAFRESTPQALDDLRRADTSALPYLSAAILRFLQEYPWTRDGLSRTERRLLELAEGRAVKLSTAFRRMHDGEKAYYVTDLSVAGLGESLSRTSPPLLFLTRAAASEDALHGTVTATDVGSAVLAGTRDRVLTCGLDRWLGGVHLRSDANLWRWDDTRQAITKA
jgi:hypothetical protein